MTVELIEIEVGSALHRSEQALRDEVLRRPLGRALSASDIERDREGHHFVAVEDGAVVACVGLYPQDKGVARLRQMAVSPRHQRSGLGSRLLAFAEAWARENGIETIVLHARLVALSFYERNGYIAQGEVFEEVSIPHKAMRKTL